MNSQDKIITTELGYKTYLCPPSQEYLKEFYAQKYYQNPQGTYQEVYSSEENIQRDLRIELLHDFIQVNVDQTGTEDLDFLDVGCGEGFVLNYFSNIGWNVTGLDFSTHAIRMKNPKLEKSIIQGDLYESIQQLIASNAKFDVVFLGNVLEHVLNPVSLVDSLSQLLAEGGLLCITVPNDFSKLQDYLVSKEKVPDEYWLAYPDHLNYFNLASLTNLLCSRGLQILDTFGDFPIEWFLVNADSNYVADKSKGQRAHQARVTLDSLINLSEDKAVKQNFWRSLSELGFGRTLTVISSRHQLPLIDE